MGVIADLHKNLGLLEALGLSIATIAPTLAMSFNVSLAAQVAGPAAPLAFAIGTLVVLVVGLSFIAWSRRVAHTGSAYGYIAQTFGESWGFLAGWALFLVYLMFGAGSSIMFGSFIQSAIRTAGLPTASISLGISALGLVGATLVGRRTMRLAGRVMLLLEALSLLAVVVLAGVIVVRMSALHQLSAQPFRPSPTHHGWAGVGYAIVFAVLSFGGFEAAATLGEETKNPHRNIPIGILGTLLLAGSLYVFISYAQVMGFGLEHADSLASDPAPLDTLAVRYLSRGYAVALDLAAALGTFSGVLGALSAAGRMLFALGRVGLAPSARKVDPKHGTVANCILLCGALSMVMLLVWGQKVAPGDFYGSLGTIGTLALILVYMGVALAQAKQASGPGRGVGVAIGVAGVALLIWPLYNSVYPVPAYPGNVWPLLVLGWLVCGGVLLLVRPELRRQKIPEGILIED